MKNGNLVLADGRTFSGTLVGDKEVVGELVFSTATTGYVEILTDPSYFGQIVVLANPEIGNYGVNLGDFQSKSIMAKALVIRNLSITTSSYRSQLSLKDWLMRENVPLFYGIDTRALIIHLREKGAMMAALGSEVKSLYAQASNAAIMDGQNLSSEVGVKNSVEIPNEKSSFHVVVMDFGIKKALLNCLGKIAKVTVVPANISLEQIWALKPTGLFLSNGPGDPKTETKAVSTVKTLLGKIPIFGVCLGHQILAQALGQKTYKLKFGHRGSNHGVKVAKEKVIITAQNHGFAVDSPGFLNVFDETNEGLERPDLKAFSVQFHPEGAPGPLDGTFYFDQFESYMRDWQNAQQLVRGEVYEQQ